MAEFHSFLCLAILSKITQLYISVCVCVCVYIYIYIYLFIPCLFYPLICWLPLGLLLLQYTLYIVPNAALNIGVHESFQIRVFVFTDRHPGVELLGNMVVLGLARSLSGKESTCKWRGRFDPWIGKIPWRKKWKSIPLFLPGKSCGQRGLVGCSSWGHKIVRHDSETKQQECQSMFSFLRNIHIVSIAATPIFVSAKGVQKFPFFFYILSNICYLQPFWQVCGYSDFDLHFPAD